MTSLHFFKELFGPIGQVAPVDRMLKTTYGHLN